MRPRRARTSVRSLATLRLELVDDGRPLPARAQQAFDGLAKRAFATARVELPRCRGPHLGRGVGGGGGDRRAQHRREIGQIIADVEDLIEADRQLLGDLLALGELVRRSLVQLLDAELARAPRERRRAAAGEEDDREPDLLRELRAEAVADVEVLDLALLARVDDLAVGPDAVDVEDDHADVGGRGRHRPGRISGAPLHSYETNRALPSLSHRPRARGKSIEKDRSEERRVGKECRSRWSPY